jgi:hypothetical protein
MPLTTPDLPDCVPDNHTLSPHLPNVSDRDQGLHQTCHQDENDAIMDSMNDRSADQSDSQASLPENSCDAVNFS